MNSESKKLTLYIVSPDGVIWNKKVDEVILPSINGELGILPSHISLMTLVDIGTLKAKINNNWTQLLIFEGVAIINENDIILTIVGIEDIEKINYTLEEAREDLKTSLNKLKTVSANLVNQTYKELRKQLEAIREVKLSSARVQFLKNQKDFNFK